MCVGPHVRSDNLYDQSVFPISFEKYRGTCFKKLLQRVYHWILQVNNFIIVTEYYNTFFLNIQITCINIYTHKPRCRKRYNRQSLKWSLTIIYNNYLIISITYILICCSPFSVEKLKRHPLYNINIWNASSNHVTSIYQWRSRLLLLRKSVQFNRDTLQSGWHGLMSM